MVISCDGCIKQDTPICRECVVTHFVGADDQGVVLDVATERAVRLLVGAGLVPRLRHLHRTAGV